MLNNLQLYQSKDWGGLTSENHLAKALLTEPQVVSNVVEKVIKKYYASKFPISSMTSAGKFEVSSPKGEFEWYLDGEEDRAIDIIGNYGDGGATPGISFSSFRIICSEKWFEHRDVLAFDDREYRARVMEDPYFDGTGWVYTMQLVTNDPTFFIDPIQITNGHQVSKDYTSLPEWEISGSTHFHTPFKLRNHLTTIGKAYSVSRKAANTAMVIELKTEDGKSTKMWTQYAEWQAMLQWYKEIERMLTYSQYSDTATGVTPMVDANGYPVFEGAGFREQIASSNRRYYTTLTESILRNFMIDLSYNVAPESSREFVCLTGEFGFAEFDRAMKDSASQFTLVDSKFITGSGNDLAYGGQFKVYTGLNGTKITLKHLPLYDDPVHNRTRHWQSGRPLESYRFTILDFGVSAGERNIRQAYRKGSEMIMFHNSGSVDPTGAPATSISTQRSNNKDGYSVFFLTERGLLMKNPLACGELICEAAL